MAYVTWRACSRRLLLLWLVLTAVLQAHETITTKLTWTAEISRIFEKHCMGCHREGGSAPMALTTYAETRPWAVAIREEVLERRMPPGSVVKGFGDFVNDGGLSQEEIQRIAEWITGGAPQGESEYLKPLNPKDPALNVPGGDGLPIEAGSVLAHSLRAQAIRPVSLRPGASLKLTAQKPDGSIEPLIWILNYRPGWNRTYVYRRAVQLPKGTRLQVHPAQAATFEILSDGPGPKSYVPK